MVGPLVVVLTACGGSDDGDDTGNDGAETAASTGATPMDTMPGTSAGTTPNPTSGPGSTVSATGSDGGDTTDGGGETAGTTGGVGPTPSAGCGNATPPSGSLQMQVEGQMGDYIVSLPPNYDPQTPYPLGFAFHGRNRTGPNCQDGDCAGFQTAMENDAVLVYMTSMGGTGWEGDGERELNVAFFEQVLDQLTSEACIDESTIFAAGTSSGAHFTNVLGCRFGDRLVAISPVAGYLPETDNCVGQAAALVIHGYADYHVELSAGETARDFWRDRNGCSTETDVPIADVHDMVAANPETNACAAYLGCDAGVPVVWCEHSEGGYDDSTHGWPLFGGQAIWDFVQAL
jgi:poly(3-hydroxybutyrate) depolymerase